ncbi:hypothetical protein CI610_02249 [invertebrate metagenome]|uniref:Mutator family transposase n=1 Tax=invertebrate metagenome TaxID=1711999 RepID=A0A2H9T6H1_9ZZZZ
MSVDLDPNLVEKLASQIKTQDDLADLSRQLLKLSIERVMAAELEDHLGYTKHATQGKNTGNSRNGYYRKTLKGDFGEIDIKIPRDRNGDFSPLLIAKGKTRINKLSQQILALCARGMTTYDIAESLEEMYGADVSHSLISKVTEAVCDEVQPSSGEPLSHFVSGRHCDQSASG